MTSSTSTAIAVADGDSRPAIADTRLTHWDAGWALILSLLSGLAYALLRQETLYGDGVELLYNASQLSISHDNHFLFLPLLHAMHSWLASSGWTWFQVATWLSILSAAIGVGITYLGWRVLALCTRRAICCTVVIGSMPALVFYATLVELHTLFFAVASLAFLAFAWLLRRPSVVRASLLGLLCGIGYLAHATGALLPAPFGAWLLASRQGSWRQRITWLLVMATGHGLVVLTAPALLRTLDSRFLTTAGNAVSWIQNHSVVGITDLSTLPTTLWNEWLHAYAPLSLVFLAALRRDMRYPVAWFCLALLPYLATAHLLLGTHSGHGAYFLPLAWFALGILQAALPLSALLAIALGAGALAVEQVTRHDQPERNQPYARDLQALVGSEPVILGAGMIDPEAALIRLPNATLLRLDRMCLGPVEPLRALMLQFDAHYRAHWQGKRRVILTKEPERLLADQAFAGVDRLASVILPHLRAQYHLVPVGTGSFHGYEVMPR